MTATLPAAPSADEVQAQVPPPPVAVAPEPAPPVKKPRRVLSRRDQVVQGVLTMLFFLTISFLLHLLVFSHVYHLVSQKQLLDTYAEQLKAGTAPVSEGTFENVLLRDGEPVGRIEIPSLGVKEIIVEGTSSGVLMNGPGHRRDTALPGQAGISVIMGRANAYGGPFNRIEELGPGDQISVITGQGEHIFEVIGVRYAGDLKPPPPGPGGSQLVLETARGLPYRPSGIARVDARLVTAAQPKGQRATTFATLAPQDRELAGDARTAWALLLATQALILAEVGVILARRRMGPAKTWVVFAPVMLLCGLIIADQVLKLLPNLL